VKLETNTRHPLSNKWSDFSCKSKNYDVDVLYRFLNILLFLCQTYLKIKYSYETLSFLLDFCFQCIVARFDLRGIIKISIKIRRRDNCHNQINVTITMAKHPTDIL